MPCFQAVLLGSFVFFFFFNDTATTEIYTLSLHDALPICAHHDAFAIAGKSAGSGHKGSRSEEHTSELQSRLHLVCRLLLEKKQKKNKRSRAARRRARLSAAPTWLTPE